MDDFTKRHLRTFADAACYDIDERDAFELFVHRMDEDDLAYVMEHGWPVALNSWRDVG